MIEDKKGDGTEGVGMDEMRDGGKKRGVGERLSKLRIGGLWPEVPRIRTHPN